MQWQQRLIPALMLALTIAGCGGGGGGGGSADNSDDGGNTATADISGKWDISERGTSDCPGEASYSQEYRVTVEQEDNDLTVIAPSGTFSGSIDGDEISWSGSYPEDGGTTNITRLTLTISADGDNMVGSADWTWSDDTTSCAGTADEITATRVPATDGDGSGDGGDTGSGSPMFEGFAGLDYQSGRYFDYAFEYTSRTNGSLTEELRGTVRIELVDSMDVTLDGPGTVTFHKTHYFTLSGDDPPFGFPAYAYIGEKDGIIYIGNAVSDGFGAARLFDSHTGHVYENGFMGFFSGEREETVDAGTIDNAFLTAPAVVVSEPFYDPECETIAGERICDDESHDYQVREYYLPGIGFGGFHRSGTSIFSGGSFVSIHESTFDVGITDTNMEAFDENP